MLPGGPPEQSEGGGVTYMLVMKLSPSVRAIITVIVESGVDQEKTDCNILT